MDDYGLEKHTDTEKQAEQKEKFWRRFWVCWMIASFIGWWWYKPLLWLALVPAVKFMFSDWEKENERINQEFEKLSSGE